MSFYDGLQILAGDVLKEFKQGVVEYVKLTPGNGPADNPGASTEIKYVMDATVRGVALKYISGLIITSDLQVIMNVSSVFIPDILGFVEIDGIRYKIVSVKPIPPAGVPVVNILFVRR